LGFYQCKQSFRRRMEGIPTSPRQKNQSPQNLTDPAPQTQQLAGIFRFFPAGAASNNTGVGAGALALTTTGLMTILQLAVWRCFSTPAGNDNVAVGTAALLNNTSGN